MPRINALFRSAAILLNLCLCNNALAELVEYALPGDAAYQSKLYPPYAYIDKNLGLNTAEKVIAHFTQSSLDTDGIKIVEGSLKVNTDPRTKKFRIRFEPQPGFLQQGKLFALAHQKLLDRNHAGQAINGAEACRATPGCWNPMEGFKVNSREIAKWDLYLPLGMPMLNHKSVTLLHYPPSVALQTADYLNNNTLWRWVRILKATGIEEPASSLYKTILDVNPIAAPGSGQAEYPNDYFPIMMSSVYFDNEKADRNYIRAMLETLLNPIHNEKSKYTLPLLVAGSPLYDPQAPGWFRVRYRDVLPQNKDGVPQMEVLQAGSIKINSTSKKATPYMGANHMIAAGVTGHCTDKPAEIPDIRRYEAQDLVAACFLKKYSDQPDIDPAQAKTQCCQQWFGNTECSGAPQPTGTNEKRSICILAQIDLYFDREKVAPKCTWEQAEAWCNQSTNNTFDACTQNSNYPNCYTLPKSK